MEQAKDRNRKKLMTLENRVACQRKEPRRSLEQRRQMGIQSQEETLPEKPAVLKS